MGFVVLRLLKGLEEGPLRVPVPRIRRRAPRPAAEGSELGLAPGVSVGGTTYVPEPAGDGILTAAEPASPSIRKRGKKPRKRKRRDVELDLMPHISDAPR